MTNKTVIHEKLRNMGLFAEFSEMELETFQELAEPVLTPAGDCIVKQDEKGDSMYIVVEGSAKVIHKRDGKEFELATLRSGDFFGEIALVDEGPRSADVEAVDDCLLIRIPQSVIRALAGVYPSAAFKLLVAVGRIMVLRLRQGNKKYIDSMLMTSFGKE